MKELNKHIPRYVTRVTETLQSAGFEAYLVGGCVRDLLMGRKPNDWDVTTNAIPEEIMGLFEHTFYENAFGTVGVVVKTGDEVYGTSIRKRDNNKNVSGETGGEVPRETEESMKTSVFIAGGEPANQPQRPAGAIDQIVTYETLRHGSGQANDELVGRTATDGRNDPQVTNDGQNVPDGVANPVRRQVTHETQTDDVDFGSLSGMTEPVVSPETTIIEVTPYRTESDYSDSRHPDEVIFSKNLEDDLKRRDFTINALAYDPAQKKLVDLYKGQNDIKDMLVRTVGAPADRFNEDALRLLRAVRFSAQLGFSIENETMDAIFRLSDNLEKVSRERIRDEFTKIIMSENAMVGIVLANKLKLLRFIVPELEKGIGVEQKGMHIYTVWEHNLRALDHAVKHGWPLPIRLASLLHDISKPETRRWSEEKNKWTFYGHDVVGGRVSRKIMERLKFPVKLTNTVSALVAYHMFFSDIEKITLSAVRRIVANVGAENVWDLMKIRACDRIGMGRPVEKPYRLRKYEAMIEEALRSPVSVGMLKIDGTRIMEVTHETPGPKLGLILHALLEEVLEDPMLNTPEYLEKRTLELNTLPVDELKKRGEEGKEKKAEAEEEELAKIRRKHGVK
jgi:poly(A) polymerase/tRNA nucleotidyltransferase (CCA-adding enzyme)